ncbi:MAG: C40 family peptidase [Gammaproteobacteria bacterium]|nr:C40 family peptidase [Gammaproteobacteria bacterium]
MNHLTIRWPTAATIAIAMTMLAGCASQPSAPVYISKEKFRTVSQAREFPRESSLGRRLARTATEMIGVPYVYGGRTPKGFDCSGLVYYSYQQAGLKVPRTSREQFKAARHVSLSDAQPGDLLFFRGGRRISHVAIYIGNGYFVHAPSTGKNVSVANLNDSYYRKHFDRAGRLHRDD